MKKLIVLLLLISSPILMASESITTVYEPEPMVPGNRRVDELIEWNKQHPGELPPLTEQEKKRFFLDEGIPVPGEGAKVRDFDSIKMTSEQASSVRSFNDAQKYKGYFEHFNPHAKLIAEMNTIAKEELIKFPPEDLDPQDSHLRSQLSQLKMNYKYEGVNPNLVKKIIGFAPEHSYLTNGWNGAVEFFIPQSLEAICAYHEINIKLTGSSASIPKEIATYKVNQKLTTIFAEGNEDSGFVYHVEWWDKIFHRILDCSAPEYELKTKQEVLELAKKIDINNQ